MLLTGTLLVDSISMLIDTATYLGNLVAEWRGSKEILTDYHLYVFLSCHNTIILLLLTHILYDIIYYVLLAYPDCINIELLLTHCYCS